MNSTPPPPPSPSTAAGVWASSTLRHETFRALWIASVFSYVGNWVQDIGESWLMLSLTHEPVLIALVPASFSMSAFVMMLPSGVWADRLDRRKILLFAQALQVVVAGILAVIAWKNWSTPAAILIASAGLGIGSALSTPSWQSLLPDLVPRSELPEVVTLNSVAYNLARTVGPAIGGLVVASTGPAAAFGLNALSFFAVIEVIRRYAHVRTVSREKQQAARNETFARAILNAIAYVKGSPSLCAIYSAVAAFAITAATVPALLPIFAKGPLGTNERGFGLLLGALGIGAVIGAIVLRKIRHRVGARPLVAIAFASYGVFTLLMSFAHTWSTAAILLIPAGMAWICAFSTLNALVQLSSPNWIRSRALALYQLAFLASWSTGATLGGVVATHLDVALAIRLAAFATVLAGGATLMLPIPGYPTANAASENSTAQSQDMQPRESKA